MDPEQIKTAILAAMGVLGTILIGLSAWMLWPKEKPQKKGSAPPKRSAPASRVENAVPVEFAFANPEQKRATVRMIRSRVTLLQRHLSPVPEEAVLLRRWVARDATPVVSVVRRWLRE